MTEFSIILHEQTPAVPEMSIEELLLHREVLEDFLVHASTKYSNGIGLAANQVRFANRNEHGIAGDRFMLPAFAKKNMETEEWKLILNPKITATHGAMSEKIEYCLTWPGKIITVDRAHSVTVEWYDIEGHLHVTGAVGFNAQVWQHEICHLNGIEEKVGKSSGGMQISKQTGRNEPCPCGSKIKYKKCCGKK